jgi:hypothetical protein
MNTNMSDEEALMSLDNDRHVHRSKLGRLRSVFKIIEKLQAKGIRNKAIVDKLNEVGFDIDIKSFQTMLSRIRKEAGITKKDSFAAFFEQQANSLEVPKNVEDKDQPKDIPLEPEKTASAGKTLTEQVLTSGTKNFSFKQLKKERGSK